MNPKKPINLHVYAELNIFYSDGIFGTFKDSPAFYIKTNICKLKGFALDTSFNQIIQIENKK